MTQASIEQYATYLQEHYERVYNEQDFAREELTKEFEKVIARMSAIDAKFTNGNSDAQEECISDVLLRNIPMSLQGEIRKKRTYKDIAAMIVENMAHGLLKRER